MPKGNKLKGENVMCKDKETAHRDFGHMVMQSWTYAKMTEEEKDRALSAILFAKNQGLLFGNYNQRWQQLNAIYNAFLLGLGYEGGNWRETDEDAPFCVL